MILKIVQDFSFSWLLEHNFSQSSRDGIASKWTVYLLLLRCNILLQFSPTYLPYIFSAVWFLCSFIPYFTTEHYNVITQECNGEYFFYLPLTVGPWNQELYFHFCVQQNARSHSHPCAHTHTHIKRKPMSALI